MAEKRIKVLLVEDNPADARLTREFLSEQGNVVFDVECVNRLSMAVEPLARGGVDIVLLDLSLPDCQELETFFRMRALAPDLPIVVETGLDDEESALKAVQQGAQDYLVKGHVDSHTLRSAICHAIERKEMQDRLLSTERQAAVAQMMTGLAHDFDVVLDCIMGYVDILKQRHDIPDAARGYISAIGREGQVASDLLRKLMDFSRRTTGTKRPVSLHQCVQETVSSLRGTLPESVETVVECDSTEPSEYVVNADPLQIQQALTNLARNARDAMPHGGKLRFGLSRVSISRDEKAPLPLMSPGSWISLEVSDTGVGIERENIPRVFEPFFSTKEKGDGFGLDLAQVYGIVRNHSGFIDVRSQVGEGTTFTIFLPALLRTNSELNKELQTAPWGPTLSDEPQPTHESGQSSS